MKQKQSSPASSLRDVMCGHSPRFININSRLAWNGLSLYGRQMSQDFKLVTYLFTWDETPEGLRGGYPIQWLRDTADHHHVLLTDTAALARDISERMGYEPGQVRTLYTPVDGPRIEAARPLPTAQPRFLWAGRFDRQKRVDILVDIARANPDLIFDVYGDTVLDGAGLESYDPPGNIHPQGTYSSLADVLATPYHGFVYTAQWDGLPTILLDIARAGLPIVAPSVGGIPEVIDDGTGWLIDDFTDAKGYSAALRAMIARPEHAHHRAEALRLRMDDQFAEGRYRKQIEEILMP